jgi:hypothetical protein
MIDRCWESLERRWREGCHNAAQLWREVRDQGFTGKSGAVRLWATRQRRDRAPEPSPCASRLFRRQQAGKPLG